MGGAVSAIRGAAVVGGEIAAVGAEAAEAVMMSGGVAAADAGLIGRTAGRIASSSGSTEFFSALGSTASDSSVLRGIAGSEASGLEGAQRLDPIFGGRRRPQSLGPSYSNTPFSEGPGFRNRPASEGGAFKNWDIPGQGAAPEVADISSHTTSTESEFIRDQIKGKQIAHDWYIDSRSVSSTGAVAGSVSEGSEISAGSISKGWSTQTVDGSRSEVISEVFSEARTPSEISSTGAAAGSEPRPLSDSAGSLSEESTGTVVHHTPPNGPSSMEAIDGSAGSLTESEPESVAELSTAANDGSGEELWEELTREGGGISEYWVGASTEAIDGSRLGSMSGEAGGEAMETIEGEVIYDGHSLAADSPVSGESTGTVVRHPPPGEPAAEPAADASGQRLNPWQDLWTAEDILSFPEETRFNVIRGTGTTIPIFRKPGMAANVKTYSSWEKAVRDFIKKEGAFSGEEACLLFGRKPGQLTGREFVAKVGKPVLPKAARRLNAMSGEEFAKLTGAELQELLPRYSRYEVAKHVALGVGYAGIGAGYLWGNIVGELDAKKKKEKYKDVWKRSESETALSATTHVRMPQTTLVVTEGLTWEYTDPLPALGIYTANDTASSIFDGDYITVPMSTGAECTLTFPPDVQRIHLTNASPRPICVAGANITTSDGEWISLSGNLGAHFNVDHYETGQQVMNGSTSCTWIDNSVGGIGIPGVTFLLTPGVDPPLGDNNTIPFMWPSNDTYPTDMASSKEPFDFSGHLVKSQLSKSSAKRLCENQYTKGPHFLSLNEKLYCDMEARKVYPTCGDEVGEDVCFNVEKDELVEPEEGNKEESEVKAEGDHGSFSKRRVKMAKRVKVLKSFKHVHVWDRVAEGSLARGSEAALKHK